MVFEFSKVKLFDFSFPFRGGKQKIEYIFSTSNTQPFVSLLAIFLHLLFGINVSLSLCVKSSNKYLHRIGRN